MVAYVFVKELSAVDSIWERVKQNERDHCCRRHIYGGYAVLVYPGRGAGGQADGGIETERGMGCRQERQTAGTRRRVTGSMRQTDQVIAGTVISGRGNGKGVASGNAITFCQRRSQYQKLCQKKCFCRKFMETTPVTAGAVHMAGISPASATVCRRYCRR